MKIAKLIKILSELDPDTIIVGFDSYNECLTKKINTEILKHTGIETNCWHSDRKFKSDIPAGNYFYITFGE